MHTHTHTHARTYGEPHVQFVFGTFRRIGSVADVAAEIDGIIAADAARFGTERLRFAEHLASLFDDVLAFPTHANNGTGAKELDKSVEKGFLGQVSVMGGGHVFGRPNPDFTKSKNCTYQRVRLDHDEKEIEIGRTHAHARTRIDTDEPTAMYWTGLTFSNRPICIHAFRSGR